MHPKQISLPLTTVFDSIETDFLLFSSFNLYLRGRKKRRMKRAPKRCQTQLIRNCWSSSAKCVYNIYTYYVLYNATAHNLFTFCWIHRFKICIYILLLKYVALHFIFCECVILSPLQSNCSEWIERKLSMTKTFLLVQVQIEDRMS